jgi:hypothetical protein
LESRAATLLKYRFGDVSQMQNHLHVVDGRTLFFYRDGRSHLPGGSRVVIEFAFSNSEQVSALRGSILARVDGENGQQMGAWVEFPDSRLSRKIDAGEAAIAGRRQRRMGCDFLVEVRHDRLPRMGRMVDVSLGGAHIAGVDGLAEGAQIEARIMGAEPPLPSQLGRAEVVRADPGGELAIRFVRTDVIARVASGKLYSAVQEAWARASEAHHPPTCCQDGNVMEPPLPHMKSRT